MSLKDLEALHLTEEQFKTLPGEEQEKYLYLLDQEVQLRRSQRILLYEPNPKLEAFHTSPATIRAIFGGNRPLVYGTQVRMANGSLKVIEKLSIGDEILCWDGDKAIPGKIVDIPFDDYSETWKVVTTGGLEIEADATHCFPAIVYRRRGLEKHTLAEIRNGGYSHKRFIKPSLYEYVTTETPFSGLLLGLYLGDGSYGNRRPVNFTNKNTEILRLFKNEVQRYFPGSKCSTYKSDNSRIWVTLSGIKVALDKLGLSHKKSDTKFIPDSFKYGNVETRRGVIEGMVLTDGCCDKYKVAIYSNSLRMLKDAEDIILSLGGRGKIYKDGFPLNDNQHQQYKLQFSIGYVVKCGLNFRHKQPKYKLIRKEREDDVIVETVIATGVKKCRCITVSHPSHAFVLGNGIVTYNSGKTTCGGMEFLFHITGVYPDWYPKDLRYAYPIKGRIVATDYQKGVGEVIIPFLEEWLDMSLVSRKIRNPLGIPIKWIMKNGSVFDILTYEQSVEAFEGWKGHVAWFDEPPPRDKYIATLRGLVDYKGRCWLTLTPLNQPWIYDEIYTKIADSRVFVVTTDIRDNPHLSEDAIKEFEQSLTEEEKEARLHGRFIHLTGLVYKEFEPNYNICEPPIIKPAWTRIMAIDPHERMPTAVLWLAVDNNDNHYVYDELWCKDMDIEQISHAIHVQEGDFKPRVRLIDPHADKDNAIAGGFNIRKELMKYGVYCERANSDPSLGKSRIRQALKPRYSSVLKTEVPQLRVSRECRQTIYEFQHYLWDDYKRNKEEYALKEQVKKKNDHFMDCLRYIYNWGPRYVIQEQEEEEVRYTGEYAKYPVKTPAAGSYQALIERKAKF